MMEARAEGSSESMAVPLTVGRRQPSVGLISPQESTRNFAASMDHPLKASQEHQHQNTEQNSDEEKKESKDSDNDGSSRKLNRKTSPSSPRQHSFGLKKAPPRYNQPSPTGRTTRAVQQAAAAETKSTTAQLSMSLCPTYEPDALARTSTAAAAAANGGLDMLLDGGGGSLPMTTAARATTTGGIATTPALPLVPMEQQRAASAAESYGPDDMAQNKGCVDCGMANLFSIDQEEQQLFSLKMPPRSGPQSSPTAAASNGKGARIANLMRNHTNARKENPNTAPSLVSLLPTPQRHVSAEDPEQPSPSNLTSQAEQASNMKKAPSPPSMPTTAINAKGSRFADLLNNHHVSARKEQSTASLLMPLPPAPQRRVSGPPPPLGPDGMARSSGCVDCKENLQEKPPSNMKQALPPQTQSVPAAAAAKGSRFRDLLNSTVRNQNKTSTLTHPPQQTHTTTQPSSALVAATMSPPAGVNGENSKGSRFADLFRGTKKPPPASRAAVSASAAPSATQTPSSPRKGTRFADLLRRNKNDNNTKNVAPVSAHCSLVDFHGTPSMVNVTSEPSPEQTSDGAMTTGTTAATVATATSTNAPSAAGLSHQSSNMSTSIISGAAPPRSKGTRFRNLQTGRIRSRQVGASDLGEEGGLKQVLEEAEEEPDTGEASVATVNVASAASSRIPNQSSNMSMNIMSGAAPPRSKGMRFRELNTGRIRSRQMGMTDLTIQEEGEHLEEEEQQQQIQTAAKPPTRLAGAVSGADSKGPRFMDYLATSPGDNGTNDHHPNQARIPINEEDDDGGDLYEVPVGAYRVNDGTVENAADRFSTISGGSQFDSSEMSRWKQYDSEKSGLGTSTGGTLAGSFQVSTPATHRAHPELASRTSPSPYPAPAGQQQQRQRQRSTSRGLAEASPVEAEAVVYAEATKDTSRRNKVLACYACMIAIVSILVGVLYPFIKHKREEAERERAAMDPRCLLPLREKDAVSHCVCSGTTAKLLELMEDDELEFYESIYGYLAEDVSGKSFEMDSCEVENQALLYISNFHRHGLDISDPRLHEIPFLGEVYAVILFYLKLGGDQWQSREGWLTDGINVCSWFGIQCGLLLRISGISLVHNGLSGPIPTEIASVSSLTLLDLSQNAGVVGEIPPGLYKTPRLHTLDLSDTNIAGQLQPEISNLERLDFILLSHTSLTGTIPTEIGRLTSLISLKLERNEITGTIPSEIGMLSRLRDFVLDRNQLTGELPTQVGLLTNIEVLDISRNHLQGTIPDYFGSNTRLEIVDIIDSGLSGTIPETYCHDEELVIDRVVVGNCSGPNAMIPTCSCCSREDFRVSLCVEDFPAEALGNA